jgi:peptidoglycan/xylan/chitin deacetylase (PgdA/CDA1 family)
MREPGVVFLMYHELEMPGRTLFQTEPGYVRYILRADAFRLQMETLKSEGWRGISVGEAVRSFPPKTVAITFDDGCETDLITAAPLLCELGFGATFYITTGWAGHTGFLSHSQIRELASLGFEIGSHSMNHLYLSDLDDAGLHREIAESKTQIEQVLGKPIEHFSCPGGRYDSRVAEIARNAGYCTVSTSDTFVNTASTDHFALGRIAIMRNTSLGEFRKLSQGRGLWRSRFEVRLRTAAKTMLGNTTYDRLRERVLRRNS